MTSLTQNANGSNRLSGDERRRAADSPLAVITGCEAVGELLKQTGADHSSSLIVDRL